MEYTREGDRDADVEERRGRGDDRAHTAHASVEQVRVEREIRGGAGATRRVRAKAREYFVVKGTEKVILIQEQLSKNRIIRIDVDAKSEVGAERHQQHARAQVQNLHRGEARKALPAHNTFADEIPILVALKAMGLESDQEAVQLVGPDPAYAPLLAPSLQECASHGIFTQRQALEYCGSKVRAATRGGHSGTGGYQRSRRTALTRSA